MSEQDEKWELPLKLRLDETNPEFEALVAQSEAQQKAWAKKIASPFSSKSPVDFERGMAAVKIAAKEQALQGMTLNDPVYARIAAQLAESYATIGRFDQAAAIDPRPNHAADWQSLWEAVTRTEATWCGCGDRPRKAGTNPQFMEKAVWSIPQNRMVYLLRCNECGFRGAVTEKPAHLAKQDEARAKAAKQ